MGNEPRCRKTGDCPEKIWEVNICFLSEQKLFVVFISSKLFQIWQFCDCVHFWQWSKIHPDSRGSGQPKLPSERIQEHHLWRWSSCSRIRPQSSSGTGRATTSRVNPHGRLPSNPCESGRRCSTSFSGRERSVVKPFRGQALSAVGGGVQHRRCVRSNPVGGPGHLPEVPDRFAKQAVQVDMGSE